MCGDDTTWFREKTPFEGGRSLGIRIKQKLVEKRSKFQKIEIYDTVSVGRMLVLDDVIQLTEADEFPYHEMFVHPAMNVHPDPKSILVVGGGDGGVLREENKYPGAQRIDICEIDGDVIELSRQYLPFTACGYDDPRVKVYVEDGADFMKRMKGAYDLILVDSSDPIGPAEVLFKPEFFETCKLALKPDGAILTQCESIFLHLHIIENVTAACCKLFTHVEYMNVLLPTYPSGMIGQMVCSQGPAYAEPKRQIPAAIQQTLKYYTPALHKAAFTLPRFAEQKIHRQ